MALTCDRCLSGNSWRCRGGDCANRGFVNQPEHGREVVARRSRPRPVHQKSRSGSQTRPIREVTSRIPSGRLPTGFDPLSVMLRTELEQDGSRYRLHLLSQRVSGEQSPLAGILDILAELR